MATPEQDAEAQYRAAAGVVFRRLRGAASLRDFAERVGIAHTSLYAVERRDASPTVDTMARVAAASGLSLAGIMALILDEMLAGQRGQSLASLLEAAGPLDDAQRAEVLGFIDYLRYRDRGPASE